MAELKPSDVDGRIVCPECGGLCCDSGEQLCRTRHACVCFSCCGFAWLEWCLERTRAFCDRKLRSRQLGTLRSDYPRAIPVTRQQRRQQLRAQAKGARRG
jgi:hypothetical protein